MSVLSQGEELFKAGLSQLPSDLFKKVYIAKRASRDCTLSRLSATLREIDALEKMKDVMITVRKHEEDRLAAISDDLAAYKAEAECRGDLVDDDIAYRHAVYADEFSALASTNTQINLMLSFAHPEPTSDETESDSDDSDG